MIGRAGPPAQGQGLAAEYEARRSSHASADSLGGGGGPLGGQDQPLGSETAFEQQVNGALNEVCDTTYKGVPYSDMNNAAKINTGLDVIRTLSKHYRFAAPIFVDNAEAVVQLLPIDSQVIRLVVSGEDKQLRIERDEQ